MVSCHPVVALIRVVMFQTLEIIHIKRLHSMCAMWRECNQIYAISTTKCDCFNFKGFVAVMAVQDDDFRILDHYLR